MTDKNKLNLIILIQFIIWAAVGLVEGLFLQINSKESVAASIIWRYSLISFLPSFFLTIVMVYVYKLFQKKPITFTRLTAIVISLSFIFGYVKVVSAHLIWMLLQGNSQIEFLWGIYPNKAFHTGFVFLSISIFYFFLFYYEKYKIYVEEKKSVPKTRIKNKLSYEDSIFLKASDPLTKLNIADIKYIKAAGDYTEIAAGKKNNDLILKTLKDWELSLPQKYFARIHRSLIINIQLIEKIEKLSNKKHTVYLKGCSEPFPLSYKYASIIKNLTHF